MPAASQKPCWARLICMAKYLNFAGRLGFVLFLLDILYGNRELRQFAELVGFKQSFLSRLENGGRISRLKRCRNLPSGPGQT